MKITQRHNNLNHILTAKLWRAFEANPSERSHEKLWLRYQPLVKFVAERYNAKSHGMHTEADLIEAGNVGLLDAIAEFKAFSKKGGIVQLNAFEPLAVPMIRRRLGGRCRCSAGSGMRSAWSWLG